MATMVSDDDIPAPQEASVSDVHHISKISFRVKLQKIDQYPFTRGTDDLIVTSLSIVVVIGEVWRTDCDGAFGWDGEVTTAI